MKNSIFISVLLFFAFFAYSGEKYTAIYTKKPFSNEEEYWIISFPKWSSNDKYEDELSEIDNIIVEKENDLFIKPVYSFARLEFKEKNNVLYLFEIVLKIQKNDDLNDAKKIKIKIFFVTYFYSLIKLSDDSKIKIVNELSSSFTVKAWKGNTSNILILEILNTTFISPVYLFRRIEEKIVAETIWNFNAEKNIYKFYKPSTKTDVYFVFMTKNGEFVQHILKADKLCLEC